MADQSDPPPGNCSSDKLSEEDIHRLLDKIHEKTGRDNSLVFRYRFHALFPELKVCDNNKFIIKDGYMQLRKHKEYYRYALSLVIYLVEEHASKEEITKLVEHVKSALVYESDIRHQRLNLWRMLSNVATELNKSEGCVRRLVGYVGKELGINTDHISIGGEYSLAAALKAFQLLEERGKLEPMLKDFPVKQRKYLYLYQLLERLHQKKLLNEVEPFNPHQPVILAVLDVESKSPLP